MRRLLTIALALILAAAAAPALAGVVEPVALAVCQPVVNTAADPVVLEAGDVFYTDARLGAVDLVSGQRWTTDCAQTRYVPGPDGTLEAVPAGHVAMPYINGRRWMLGEPQSENLSPYSTDFESWGSVEASIHGTLIAAPDGTNAGRGIVCSVNNGLHRIQLLTGNAIPVSEGETYTQSIYVKPNLKSWILIYFYYLDSSKTYISGSSTGGYSQAIGSDWQRLSQTRTVPDKTPDVAYVVPQIWVCVSSGSTDFVGDGTDPELWVWGHQIEKHPVVTSYIPTAGSAVARDIQVPSIARSAAVEAALASQGFAAARVMTGFDSSDAADSSANVGILSATNTKTSVMYWVYSSGNLISYDGTNFDTYAWSFTADTEYIPAAKWGDALEAGLDDTWSGSPSSFAGYAISVSDMSAGYGNTVGPILWDKIIISNSPKNGSPAELLR